MRKHYYLSGILAALFVFAICGCTFIKDVSNNISGSSLKGLERKKENSISQVFDCEISDCFDRVVNILGDMHCEILKIDVEKYSILSLVWAGEMFEQVDSIYEANRADVGIFFTEEEPGKTKVEINSFSTFFIEYTAKRIFSRLEQKN